MAYDVRNRVVLVTGASGGIGRAIAVEFHRAGAYVVAAARSEDKLRALAAELGRQRILAVRADVTLAEDRARLLDESQAQVGDIDVLVNNAGWASFATALHTPVEHMERMIALNMTAPIALAQTIAPKMVRRGTGQIIIISSVVGTQAIPRMSFYCATKAALNSWSSGLRMELRGRGVDVLVVAPGSTRTEFFASAATVDAKATRIAASQYSPQRVARAVLRSSRRRRPFVTLTASGKAIVMIRRLSHRLADAIMYRVAKSAMPQVPLTTPTKNK